MRVVSFVPGATAAVAALGMRQQLVGVTHECGTLANLTGVDARVLTRSRVPTGGTGAVVDQAVRTAKANKNDAWVLDGPALAALKPDVVIVPVEPPEGRTPCLLSFYDIRAVTSLMDHAPRLVAYGTSNLQEVFGSIRALGEVLGPGAEAARFAAELRGRVDLVRSIVATAQNRPRVGLLTWINPPIGSGGILAQLVLLAGGEPVLGDATSRARLMDWAQVLAFKPQVLVLAPCGFTLERARADAEGLRKIVGVGDCPAARWGQVHVVDAVRYFSSPGVGSVRGLEILAALIHPELPWPDAVLPGDAARHLGLD